MGNKIFIIIKELNLLLSKEDKKLFFLIVIYSFFISIIELIGVSAVVPLIALISDSTNWQDSIVLKIANYFTNIDTLNTLIIFYSILLILFYIFRVAVNIFYSYLQASYTHGKYKDFSIRLFKTYMGLEYQKYTNKNTGAFTKAIINEADNLSQFIYSFIGLITEFFVFSLLMSLMLYVDWKVTLYSIMFVGIIGFILHRYTKKVIYEAGVKREKKQKQIYKILNSSFGNFKIIKFSNSMDKIESRFVESTTSFVKSNINKMTFMAIPQQFFQCIGMITIVFMVLYYALTTPEQLNTIIIIVSIFVMIFLRILPSITKMMLNIQSMLFLYQSFSIVRNELSYPIETIGNERLEFNNLIKLQNISFSYGKKNVLDNINLEINKNSKVAFIGESGSGKSTLLDIIIGLYKVHHGELYCDTVKVQEMNLGTYRNKIGYVPQSVYLFDGTIAQNIVFDREYDEKLLIDVLKKAKIFDFIQTKEGLDTFVGEDGIQLSGGQKQRIAIARALYGKPEILVLDEATSALDNETERQIMDEIYEISKDMTLLIVAHRLSTIGRCEKIYVIKNKKISNLENVKHIKKNNQTT